MSQADPPIPPDNLLLFAPVPIACLRANGWSPEVQRAFVAALARSGVVAAAARSVGRSARSAYLLRQRAGDDSAFVRAWDCAHGRAADRALDETIEAGMQGRRTEVWHRGRHVGWRTSYDNRLALAALRALDRREAQYSTAGLDAQELLDSAMKLLDEREK